MINWFRERRLERLEIRLVDILLAVRFDAKSKILAEKVQSEISALRKKLGYDNPNTNWKA